MENIPSAHRRPKFRLEEMTRVSLVKFTVAFTASFLVCVLVVKLLLNGIDSTGNQLMVIADGDCFPNCFGEQPPLPDDTKVPATPIPESPIPESPSSETETGATKTVVPETDEPVAQRHIEALQSEGLTSLPISAMGKAYLIRKEIDTSQMSKPFVYRLLVRRTDGSKNRGIRETLEFKTIPSSTSSDQKQWDVSPGVLECPIGSETCSVSRKLFHNRDFDSFYFNITDIPQLHDSCSIVTDFSVRFEYRSKDFITTEVGVRYVFVVFSMFLSAAFYYKIAFSTQKYPWKAWALEQKWTFILLVLLVGFNNPLCLSSDGQPLYVFIDYCLLYTFLVGYMLAVLSMTDHMAQSARKSTNLFYGPKLALCGPLWLVLVGCAYSFQQDPELLLENVVAVTFISVMIAIYVLWLFALIAIMIQKVTTSKTTNLHISLRFKAVWSLNILMLAAVAAALYRSSAWETGSNADEFLLGYIGFNLYVAILAALFIPAESSMPYRPPPPQPAAQADVIINDEYEVEGDFDDQ